jgi:hypothetical protein
VTEAGWADRAVDDACARAEEWYLGLPSFPARVNLGSVVGYRHPALVSEQDCVMHFARFLNESGVAWESIHHQVSVSRWLFDSPHPAATAGDKRWRVDLALLEAADFLHADLPAVHPGFEFDAFLEFAYLSDAWTQEGSARFGEPEKGRKKVAADVEKIGRYLKAGACRSGYVIAFEECDFGFSSVFAAEAEEQYGCRVRFVRGYRP